MRTVTFPTLQGYWTPIIAAKKLGKKLHADMLDGVPIVLFRDAEGKVQALVDRCPHRSIKLSIGKLATDGTIECSFHGWRFDGSGACKHMMLNPGANLGTVRAQALAATEYAGLIWLFAGEPQGATALALPPLYEASWSGAIIVKDWNVHWSRGVQTQLDTAHIPIVHPKTIGAGLGRVDKRGFPNALGSDSRLLFGEQSWAVGTCWMRNGN